MDGWMDMDGLINGWMDMDGLINGWMDGWIVWMDMYG